jgi:hypothetical protein
VVDHVKKKVNKKKIGGEVDWREKEMRGYLKKYAGIWAWDGWAIL